MVRRFDGNDLLTPRPRSRTEHRESQCCCQAAGPRLTPENINVSSAAAVRAVGGLKGTVEILRAVSLLR
jgi:hypothetical protein